jgi:hypothetical protein
VNTPSTIAAHGAHGDHRDGVLQVGQQQVADRLLVGERDAHVPVGQVVQVDEVLLPLRLVQAELGQQRVPQRRGRVRDAGQVGDRVAGQHPEQEEVDRDGDEDRHQGEEAPLDHVVSAAHPGQALTAGARCPWAGSTSS